MLGNSLLTQGLVVDPHVGKVQITHLRDVEEPRESSDKEDPNGASLVVGEARVLSRHKQYSLLYRPVINKPNKPFSLFLRNDGLENKGKCRGLT